MFVLGTKMRHILRLVLASLVATGVSGFGLAASSVSPLIPAPIAQVGAVAAPTIAIDPANRAIGLDLPTLSRLVLGTPVSVAIAGAGRFDFVIDHFDANTDVTEIGGYLSGDAGKRMTFGLRGDIVTGLISVPGMTYAIGYGSNNQTLIGAAGTQWMVDTLRTQLSLKEREALKGEVLPATALPAKIDLAVLHVMKDGESTVMQLPGIGATRVTLDQLQVGASTTWVGHLTDFGPSYTATITYSPAGADGYIVTPDGAVKLSMSNLDQPYLFNPVKAGFQPVTGDCVEPLPAAVMSRVMAESAAQVTTANVAASRLPASTVPPTANATATSSQIIDVLVYYTPGMLSAYGSLDKLTTRVDQLVALSNQAYTAGKLPHQIRRVGLELINIADNNSNSITLSQFASGQGAFAGVGAKRDQLGADLVAILRPLYAQVQGSCGVAYVSGGNQTNVASYAGYAYAVISDGHDQAGQPYYCDDISFAHELGHNEGLMHDRATVAQQSGGAVPLPTGATSYAYGYAVGGQFGTIMSYTTPHLVKFSSPLDSTCNGNMVCGVASSSTNSADNVAALAVTLPTVAAFRTTVVPPANSVYVSGITTVNGTATAGVNLTTNNSNVACSVSGTSGLYTCAVPAGTTNLTITPAYAPAGGGTVTWLPASVSLASVTANLSQNFAGTLVVPVNVVVSGKATINGVATAGVSFTTNNSKVVCTVSNSVGAYSCTVPKGIANLTITPKYQAATGSTLTWQPASVTLASVTTNVAQNFAGTLKIQTVTLSGIVTVNGLPTAGVKFATNNSAVACASSASTGSYSCSIPSGTTNLTITPQYPAVAGTTVTWKPSSITLASVTGNVTQNFAATVASSGTYTVEIKVILNNVATTSVPMSISYTSPGTVPLTCSMNTNVSYVCKATSGTKMTITPGQISSTKPITYTPTSQSVSVTQNTAVTFSGVRK
jgi:hypothetical protein